MRRAGEVAVPVLGGQRSAVGGTEEAGDVVGVDVTDDGGGSGADRDRVAVPGEGQCEVNELSRAPIS